MQAHMRPPCGRCLTCALQFGNALPKNILGSEKVTAMDCATLRASPEPILQLKLLVDIAACTRL